MNAGAWGTFQGAPLFNFAVVDAVVTDHDCSHGSTAWLLLGIGGEDEDPAAYLAVCRHEVSDLIDQLRDALAWAEELSG